MPSPTPYDALLLVSFGGPEQPEDVVPFLRNVTAGKNIPDARLEEVGENRVRVHGITGKPATDKLKVSIAFRSGWKAVGTLVYSWPDAMEKAQLADRVLRLDAGRLGGAKDLHAPGQGDL